MSHSKSAAASWNQSSGYLLVPGLLVCTGIAFYGIQVRFHENYFSFHRHIIRMLIIALSLLLTFLYHYRHLFRLPLSGYGLLQKNCRWVLSVLAVVSTAGFYNFGKFHGNNFIHYWEFTHYYLGAEYFPELGYQNLYKAMIAAEREQGFLTMERYRDLHSKEISLVRDHLAEIQQSKLLFSKTRWQQFKRHVIEFRSAFSQKRWSSLLLDHGFNPPPGWTMWGRLLTGALQKTGWPLMTRVKCLSLLDPLLLVMAFLFLLTTFGAFRALLAHIIFTTGPFLIFDYTGGAFLRQDWFFFTVAAFCLLYRKNPVLSGIFFALASASRVFPLVFLAFPFFQGCWLWFHKRRIPQVHLRLGISTLISAGCLVAVSQPLSGRGGAWYNFFVNITTHDQGVYTNHISVKNAFHYEPEQAGFVYQTMGGFYHESWRHHKEQRLSSLKPLTTLLIFLFLVWGFLIFRNLNINQGTMYFSCLPFLLFYPANYYIMYTMPFFLLLLSDSLKSIILVMALLILSAASLIMPRHETWFIFCSYFFFFLYFLEICLRQINLCPEDKHWNEQSGLTDGP